MQVEHIVGYACHHLSSGTAMETISIQVDADIARAFQSAQPDEQQKIQALVALWLKRAMDLTSLQIVMDQMSDEAEANGLTPTILQSIFNE
jgi:Holliday junction resolvase-like predicted endonuclease